MQDQEKGEDNCRNWKGVSFRAASWVKEVVKRRGPMRAWKLVAVRTPAAWKQARKGGVTEAVEGGWQRRVPRMYSRIWALVDRVIGGMMKKFFFLRVKSQGGSRQSRMKVKKGVGGTLVDWKRTQRMKIQKCKHG